MIRSAGKRTGSALLTLMCGFLLTGCDGGEDPPEGAIGSDTTAQAARAMTSPPGGAVDVGQALLSVPFQRMEADTADEITGNVRVYPPAPADTAGGFRLEVVMDGITAGAHAWHIHSGACARAHAPIAVPFTRTEAEKGLAHPLSADAGASARALVSVPANELPLDSLETGEYSLRVHLGSGVDPGPPVACADLR